MPKSLVTGGAGFIGSHIVDELIKKDHIVTCIDNEFANNENFFWNEKAKNIKGNIIDDHLLKHALKGIDYVFHCAAESKIGSSLEDPIETMQINVLGTCKLLHYSKQLSIKRFIYSSTSSGYGLNPCPNKESQIDDCLNPYALSKVTGEKLCKMYFNLYGLETIMLRYFNVFGERSPSIGQYCPVISTFLEQKKSGLPLTIVGDGNQKRDFIHVSDVVSANIYSTNNKVPKSALGEVYNIGYGKNISINEIAKMISDKKLYVPSRKGEVIENLADISKFKKIFNWNPKISVTEWIKEQLN
tara:strand:- start:3603 stop:4502 length:900 start_codon:yes stop_codon:yes gene_type:complete